MANRPSTLRVSAPILSSDSLYHLRYPRGDWTPPGAGPLILYLGSTHWPTSGGENGLGGYVWIFGTGFGNFSDYGVTNHVFINGTEVANYRHLKNAVGSGTPGKGNGVFETMGIQCLCVQPGNIGTAGSILKVDVVVNGVHPINPADGLGNYLDADGVALILVQNAGRTYYVDPVNGSDSNSGAYSTPLKTLQSFTGSGNLTGALFCSGSVGGATVSNTIAPGSHVYLLNGTYATNITSPGSLGNRWACTWQLGGIPTTASATSGPIVVAAYPGAAGANAAHFPAYVGANGSQGGIHGTDSARSNAATPWGTTGFGRYMHLIGLNVTANPYSGADGAPINMQNQAVGWRITDCYTTWKFVALSHTVSGAANNGSGLIRLTVDSTSDMGSNGWLNVANVNGTTEANGTWQITVIDGTHIDLQRSSFSHAYTSGGVINTPAQAAGIANGGVGVCRFGNFIDDIRGDPGFENHAIYIGAGGGNNEQNSYTAYNVIRNIANGSGIQFHSGNGDGGNFYTGVSVHHNWIQGANKYGFNGNTSFRSGNIWQNVIVDAGNQAIYFGTSDINATNGVEVTNNTVIGWAQFAGSTGYTALWNNGAIAGSILAQNNVFYQRAAVTNPTYGFVSGSGITLDTNCYYDASGNLTTKGAGDTGGFFSNPLFNALGTLDFTPGASSPLRNAGVTPPTQGAIGLDFAFLARPQGTNTKYAIGAYERAGG